MPTGPNLLRRGAVYSWRRRLPPALAASVGTSHVRINLEIKESSEARFLGAQLDATAMETFLATETVCA